VVDSTQVIYGSGINRSASTPVADCDLKTFLERQSLFESLLSSDKLSLLMFCCAISSQPELPSQGYQPANILFKNGECFHDLELLEIGVKVVVQLLRYDWSLSPAYAAPEVAEWKARNEAADIWSLVACILIC